MRLGEFVMTTTLSPPKLLTQCPVSSGPWSQYPHHPIISQLTSHQHPVHNPPHTNQNATCEWRQVATEGSFDHSHTNNQSVFGFNFMLRKVIKSSKGQWNFQSEWNAKMPWQPYKQSRDSSPRASRSPSPSASASSREGRRRRRPSYLDQFDVQVFVVNEITEER